MSKRHFFFLTRLTMFSLSFICYIYLAWVFISMSMSAEVKGQLPGTGSLLLYGPWELNSGHQAWQSARWPAEPSSGLLSLSLPHSVEELEAVLVTYRVADAAIDPSTFPAKLRPGFSRSLAQPNLQGPYQLLWFCFLFSFYVCGCFCII